MYFKSTISASILAIVALTGTAQAQSLRSGGVPAEVPSASYKGNQYVDSRGCVFIRAGVDGAVTWVPRVTRDRKLVCGQQPTDVAGTIAIAEAQKAEQDVVQITLPPEPAAAPTPAPVTVSAKRPSSTRAPVKVVPVRPSPVTVAQPAHPPAAIQPVAPTSGPCGHLSAQSRQYLSHPSVAVRCGSQTQTAHGMLTAPSAGYSMPSYQSQNGEMVVAGAYPGQVVKRGTVDPNTPVIPKHLANNRAQMIAVQTPPAGYRPVWQDGRHNPDRAVGTMAGQQSMEAIWDTSKTPMVLRQPSHKPVGQQGQYTGGTSSVSSSSGGTGCCIGALFGGGKAKASAQYGHQKTMVITPNTYVHVAAFHSAADAQRVAQRVRAMGLPVRIGKKAQGYQDIRMVLAGPFQSHHDVQRALSAAHAAGFSNAHVK